MHGIGGAPRQPQQLRQNLTKAFTIVITKATARVLLMFYKVEKIEHKLCSLCFLTCDMKTTWYRVYMKNETL